jgi:hypothetical protein
VQHTPGTLFCCNNTVAPDCRTCLLPTLLCTTLPTLRASYTAVTESGIRAADAPCQTLSTGSAAVKRPLLQCWRHMNRASVTAKLNLSCQCVTDARVAAALHRLPAIQASGTSQIPQLPWRHASCCALEALLSRGQSSAGGT